MKAVLNIRSFLVVSMLAGMALFSSPVFASAPLVTAVETALKTNPATRDLDVTVSQRDNAIVLDGKVGKRSIADNVSVTAAKVDGVTHIINNLEAS